MLLAEAIYRASDVTSGPGDRCQPPSLRPPWPMPVAIRQWPRPAVVPARLTCCGPLFIPGCPAPSHSQVGLLTEGAGGPGSRTVIDGASATVGLLELRDPAPARLARAQHPYRSLTLMREPSGKTGTFQGPPSTCCEQP
jgi:hypothetical protein